MTRSPVEGRAPTKTCKGLTFFPVPTFDNIDAVFGAKHDKYFNRRDLPKVPGKYEEIAQNLFFNGGEIPPFLPAVDRMKAKTALRAWLSSFAPAHEEKISTAAYAMWVWTEGDLP